MSSQRVLVVHSEARHNYAIPAAFANADMLEAFYTDICNGCGVGKYAEAISALPLPSSIQASAKRLANRRPPAEVLPVTKTAGLHALRFEFGSKIAGSQEDGFTLRRKKYVELGRVFKNWGLGNATHVMNVFGEADELLQDASKNGLTVLSDMVIALSTYKIIRSEYERFPDWGEEPPKLDSWPGGGWAAPPEHQLALTDIFICPSTFVADDLVENWGVSKEATRIVPYALSSHWFDVKPAPEPNRILFVGTAERRKGIHYLAMAASKLGKETNAYDFRVAGHVAEQVRQQKESNALNFLGRVPRSSIMDEYAKADVFVLPTLAEGSATVVYEAMAAGVPVITTKSAGSVIVDGENGCIIPERDPDALIEAIKRVTQDRPFRDRIAATARESAKEFTWSAYAARLRSVID